MEDTAMSDRRPPLRVAVVCDRVGATQQISFAQPLARAVAAGEASLVMVSDRHNTRTPDQAANFLARHAPTVLVFSRYTEGKCEALTTLAREAGIPIVFHIDDDLLDPPPSLGKAKYEHYRDPARLASLRAAMNGADLVYASTFELGQALRSHGIRSRIVAGDVYCSVAPDSIRPPLPATGPVIGYMGTEGHAQDLALVVPAIEALMGEFPSLRFETFGTIAMPQQLLRFQDRVMHHPPIAGYPAFLAYLAEIGWWLGLAPLEDGNFNRCKADTKWVEYSMAGIAVVAAAGPVYRRACAEDAGMLAATKAEWLASMRLLLRNGARRRAQVAAAQDKLRQVYAHAALEQQVIGVLGQACEVHLGRRAA